MRYTAITSLVNKKRWRVPELKFSAEETEHVRNKEQMEWRDPFSELECYRCVK
jgi:hypothetical protein